MLEMMLGAIVVYYQQNIDDWNISRSVSEQLPFVDDVAGLLPLLSGFELHIGRPNANKVCGMGLLCECEWDSQAGVGVLLEAGYVVDVGPASLVLEYSRG
jgi:hypothetical protein